ncbi:MULTISPECIES: class II fructose-bisphosphate aldolase [unclassified Actinomyces]|uniref:class II fructose-bisphosphate aldolase n=1 Tax=unclassified Actinomyces TaxID=2609248 RepID=UPI000D5984AC|nr:MULTISPECIES: class II fructose-bisphosphate aldolase [unclassified Actinomyces]RAX22005.1 ketose-bisphosphate aldolase [Actinomyces sp. Z3]
MYIPITPMLAEARRLGYTVGAFNAHNLEMVPAMIRAARDLGSPIIIQTSPGTARYVGMKNLVAVCRAMAEDEIVDVALHLDHATDLTDIRDAIAAGYSSVMFDGSQLPFTENVAKSRRVVAFAHEHGVSVEAEIGTIGGTEEGIRNREGKYTQPEEAQQFLAEVDCDALAVSIGTNHGQFKSKTKIDLDLLGRINDAVAVPLVVHGGTGVDEADYPELTAKGIRKFNVGTELLVGWTRKAQETFGATKVNSSLRNNIVPCNDVVGEIVAHKIALFMGRRPE